MSPLGTDYELQSPRACPPRLRQPLQHPYTVSLTDLAPPEPSEETVRAVHSSTASIDDANRVNAPARLPRRGREDLLLGRDVVDLQRYLVQVGAYPVCAHVHATRAVERNHELK
jgi:hypothetical protein